MSIWDDSEHPDTQNVRDLKLKVEHLQGWVADLQSGMYVNCVYCGHRYGPGETTPVSMADALKAHIEVCPEHPMSAMRKALICARNQDAFLEFPRYARELIDRALDGSV
jgi:hypothetical protein